MPITFTAPIKRKQPDLPRFVVVPAAAAADRSGAFDATVSLNGQPPFPRRIHPWGKGQHIYFFNLTSPQCARNRVDTGDICNITLSPA